MRRVEREVVTDEPVAVRQSTTVRRVGTSGPNVAMAVMAAALVVFIIWLVATFLA